MQSQLQTWNTVRLSNSQKILNNPFSWKSRSKDRLYDLWPSIYPIIFILYIIWKSFTWALMWYNIQLYHNQNEVTVMCLWIRAHWPQIWTYWHYLSGCTSKSTRPRRLKKLISPLTQQPPQLSWKLEGTRVFLCWFDMEWQNVCSSIHCLEFSQQEHWGGYV